MKSQCCMAYVVLLHRAFIVAGAQVKCSGNSNGLYSCRSRGLISSKDIRNINVSSDAVGLDLSHNNLSLGDWSFSKFKNLKSLNLSHGHLSELKRNSLKGLASLTQIDLSSNNLVTLPLTVFHDLDNLLEVNLKNNKWDCDCNSGLLTLLESANFSLGKDTALCYTPLLFSGRRIDEGCDNDECLEENDCDDMAVCKNTPASYTCQCQTTGFEGSGKECTDIDECAGANGCSKNGGRCMNTHGSYTCSCKDGYQGDGYTCQDIDECEAHECGSGGCTNTEGSYTCECYQGYMENQQHVCVDIDECKTSNHTCGAIEHSYCHNLEKFSLVDEGYECLCEAAFRKVGRSCIPAGYTMEFTNILALIIGIFIGVLVIIISSALFYRKWKLREPTVDKTETKIVMAPAVGLGPPIDFAYLGMPQEVPQGDTGEWEELEEEETWLE